MSEVFADTPYWIALLTRNHRAQDQALRESVRLQATGARLVTTREVLIEVLTHFSNRGPELRVAAADAVAGVYADPEAVVVERDRAAILAALAVFRSQSGAGWSLVDCISMDVMRERGIVNALTSDGHFREAGFRPLLR